MKGGSLPSIVFNNSNWEQSLTSLFRHALSTTASLMPTCIRIALDIAQVRPEQVIYIDDRAMFVEVAQGLGDSGHHSSQLQVHTENP